ADGACNRGMQWQGMSLRMTLHHEPTPWIPSSYMPTLAGRLFYLKEFAGPLETGCHWSFRFFDALRSRLQQRERSAPRKDIKIIPSPTASLPPAPRPEISPTRSPQSP